MKTIIALLTILSFAFGAWFYIDKTKANCEDVKKIDYKVDKTQQMMEFKFKALDLKTTEDRIYDMEKRYGKNPTDSTKAAELEKLRREREQTIRDMNDIKGK